MVDLVQFMLKCQFIPVKIQSKRVYYVCFEQNQEIEGVKMHTHTHIL